MASRLPLLPGAELPAIAPTVGIQQIAFELGQSGRALRYLVRTITGLQQRYGFPAPLPLHWRGQWIDTVHPQSRWPRVAVERWFHDRLPPDDAAALDQAALAAAGDKMDANAHRLFAIQGGRA